MKNYYVLDNNGDVLKSGVCSDEVFDIQAGEGQTVTEGVIEIPRYSAPPPSSYWDLRIASYPSVGQQLDAIWKFIESQDLSTTDPAVTLILNHIKYIKEKFPKDNIVDSGE